VHVRVGMPNHAHTQNFPTFKVVLYIITTYLMCVLFLSVAF